MQILHPRDRPTGFTTSGFDAAYSTPPISMTPAVRSRDLTALTVPKTSTTPDVEMTDLGGMAFDTVGDVEEELPARSGAQTDKVRSYSLILLKFRGSLFAF